MAMKPHITMNLGTVVIPGGTSVSSSMDFTRWRGGVSSIIIYGPGTLTGTARVQVSTDKGTTWMDKQSSGRDITIPADGSVTIRSVDRCYLRIASSANEGADRIFKIQGEEAAS
jgi:hypothetical protein